MKITIITLFPEVFLPILNSSILGRAQRKGKLKLELVNLRDFGEGAHKVVDDKPFGGGVGMVLKANVLARAVKQVTGDREQGTEKMRSKKLHPEPSTLNPRVILMSPSGTPYKQQRARELSKLDHLIIVCGHYEGVDQRFIDKYVDEEVSIGDYVLTGGELPAMIIIDTITRLIHGVLEKQEATQKESFEDNLLEHPHYTRPQEFEGEKVAEVLISGNHHEIEVWRKTQSFERTKRLRPDLLKKG